MARSETVELVAAVTAEVDAAVSDFGRFGDSVKEAASEADKASDKVRSAADATDDLDSKSAAATGSLGALSSGFELVGLDQYAGALQGAAMATDFFSGIGQGLTLILELQSIQWLKNKIQIAANAVATAAATVATQAMAVAQWALNAAMDANPIALIIIAIVALVAGLVLLYKRSETARGIMNALWSALKSGAMAAVNAVTGAINGVIAAAASVITWFRNTWATITSLITTPIKTATDKISGWFGDVWDAVKDFPRDFGDLFTRVKNAITNALSGVGSGAIDTLRGWANSIIDVINKLIKAFNKLPGPDIPTIPHITATAAASAARTVAVATPSLGALLAGPAVAAGGAGTVVNIEVTGAVDPEGTARQIRRLLEGSSTRHGGTIVRGLRTV